MKLAIDFRYIAREALRGKWKIAVIAGLIASMLGGLGANEPEVKLNIDMLCAFTLGIGSLWLTQYKQAATAAFYREISRTERRVEKYTYDIV